MSKLHPTEQQAIPFMQFRGGSSKSLCFSSKDLPSDPKDRDQVLLAAMGRDSRQIDGLGGGNPLTSKVAIIGPSSREGCDVDYLFAQVMVGQNKVDTTPNCGNILSAVGPYAIESKMVTPRDGETNISVNLVNTGSRCNLLVQTPNSKVQYFGSTKVDGVPGTAAPVVCHYSDIAGSVCGSLLPTGNAADRIEGIDVTCIDNGMPVVLLRAESLGKTGKEAPEALMSDANFKMRLEALRLATGQHMKLGDVKDKAIPKMTLVSTPCNGGAIHTRTFIPHNCHAAIGVLGAVSIATACLQPGSITNGIAVVENSKQETLSIEHPSGEFSIEVMLDDNNDIKSVGLIRTARLLSRGELYI